jgi:hypothetical protein
MPTVSRLAADDDGSPASPGPAEASGSDPISSGPGLPLTLHRDHSESEAGAPPAAEPVALPSPASAVAGSVATAPTAPTAPTATSAAAPLATASTPSSVSAVAARPISVARLTDTAPGSASVGGLVGTKPLLQRRVQRSAEVGASVHHAPSVATPSNSAIGALAKVSSPAEAAPATIAMPTPFTALGEGAPAIGAGSYESAPAAFALPQRRLASTAAQASSPHVSRSVQRAAVQQLPATALPLAPTRGPSQASIEATAMAVAQRAIDARAEEAPPAVEVSAPPPASVQREPTDGTSTSTEAAGTSTAASSTGQSPAELEALATKLWGRLRLQLRRELLADRERAGMLTDLH